MYTTDEDEGLYGNNSTKMGNNGLPVSSDEWLEGPVHYTVVLPPYLH